MRRSWICGAAACAIAVAALGAQSGDSRSDFIRKKLAAIRQYAEANQASLRRYTWIETVRFLLKDELRSTWKFACRYGADGRIERTPIGPPPPGTTAGPLAPSEKEGTKEHYAASLQSIRAAVALYVPPDPRKLEEAFQAGRVRTEKPIQGEALLRISDYAKPGDSLFLDFRTDLRKLVRLQAASSPNDPTQAVTIDVRYATLPDGTNHPKTVEVAEAGEAFRVMIESSDYRTAP
jgi:hypothetical protein